MRMKEIYFKHGCFPQSARGLHYIAFYKSFIDYLEDDSTELMFFNEFIYQFKLQSSVVDMIIPYLYRAKKR